MFVCLCIMVSVSLQAVERGQDGLAREALMRRKSLQAEAGVPGKDRRERSKVQFDACALQVGYLC